MKSTPATSLRRKPSPVPLNSGWVLRWSSAFFLFAIAAAARAQGTADITSLQKQVDTLQQGQKEMQKELEEIRKLLMPPERPMPESVGLNAGDTPFRGYKKAKIVLLEYFDYQCPFCATFFNHTMPQVLSDYVLKGKVKYVVRDFPLEAVHPNALRAAEAAHCANDQGKFWPMHDAVMGNSGALDRPKLRVYARDVQLDVSAFDKCVDSGKYASKINDSVTVGTTLGVEGTPTFFLGVVDASGQKIESVQRFDGVIPYSKLKDAIDRLLAGDKPTSLLSTGNMGTASHP
jgi:protein-disulfide isomerase